MDEQYLYVDSRHRNTATYKNSNQYTAFLVSPITSICRVDLVSASIPVTSSHTSDKTSSPYIFLDIEQFRSKYGIQSTISNNASINTTPIIQNYFGQVFYGALANTQPYSSNLNTSTGNTMYYSNIQSYKNYSEYEYKTSVSFQQPIESLDRLNIRWVDYDNKLVVFDPTTASHSFLLRVYTTQKKIDPPHSIINSTCVIAEDPRVYIFLIILVLSVLIILRNA